MKLEVFEKIILKLKEQNEKTHSVYSMGVDLIDFCDGYESAMTLLLRAYYGEEGADWISWFLYERDDHEGADPNQAWDKDNNPICYDIPSLWKQVEEIRCATDFVEYELPKRDQIGLDQIARIINGFGS